MSAARPTRALRAGVVAFAGRRVDAADAAVPRFPLTRRARVQRDIEKALNSLRPPVLIGSAACGADLLALHAAMGLRIRTRIILPSPPEAFKETSVLDRDGDWGPVFDKAIEDAAGRGDVVVIPMPAEGWEDAWVSPYVAVNARVLEEAKRVADDAAALSKKPAPPVALVAWDGRSRGADDITDDFRRRAAALGFRVDTVLTL